MVETERGRLHGRDKGKGNYEGEVTEASAVDITQQTNGSDSKVENMFADQLGR